MHCIYLYLYAIYCTKFCLLPVSNPLFPDLNIITYVNIDISHLLGIFRLGHVQLGLEFPESIKTNSIFLIRNVTIGLQLKCQKFCDADECVECWGCCCGLVE